MAFDDLLKDGELPIRSTGYDREAVDELLQATEERLVALVSERDELRARLVAAEGELERTCGDMQDIQGALLAAVEIKAEATRTAELVVAGARHHARKLLAEAQTAAHEIGPDEAEPLDSARMLEDIFERVVTEPTGPVVVGTSQ